jgi:two-component system, OmpR family, sensor histidine kinase TctE
VTQAKPSLRRRLVQHVLVPLVATWAAGTAMMFGVSEHFVAQAFDRALLDDAYDLASHVHRQGEELKIALSEEEMETLLFDQSERQYFALKKADGTLVAGRAGLPASARIEEGDHEFDDIVFEGLHMRAVTVHAGGPKYFIVVMAQTTYSRATLLERLLAYSALPQAVLLALLAWWLRKRIQGELQPLTVLQEAIERRHATDLAPLPEAVRAAAGTGEVEHISQAIDSLLARLQQSLRSQREFAGTVAHELRTPLAGIRAQAAFALTQDEPRIWREQLQGIEQAEQRASRLVDQLLAIARADEGKAGLTMETIDLGALAREVLLRWIPRAHAASVDLGGDGLDEPALVRGDRALIEGILNNLIDNAMRYGRSQGEPRITVAVSRVADRIELSVTDNGPGLSTTEIEPLKQRWVQGDPGERVGEGVGLGLAIVTRYAELLGARLSLANTDEGGLRANIELPSA